MQIFLYFRQFLPYFSTFPCIQLSQTFIIVVGDFFMKRLEKFMDQRYGVDELGNFLFIVFIILWGISFFYSPLLFICEAILIYNVIRMLSKNYEKRNKENDKFLNIINGSKKFIKRQWNKRKYRKTHVFLQCPYCHQHLRIPKPESDNITVRCPVCNKKFQYKKREKEISQSEE